MLVDYFLVLIDFCAYGTAKRKTLVIIVKFYENILLEKRHVRVQRKYFFQDIFGNKTLLS